MGVYKKAVITNAGRALMARSIAGEIVMQFSWAVTSSHIYPSDTDFKGYTSLEGIQQTVIPSNVQVVNDTLISVRSLFGNESISESYLIQNIGLYATDGNEEILFSVSQATTPDEMPAYNGVAPSSFIYTIQATVLQANSLSLTIIPAGTATTQDILDLDGAKLDKSGDISETVVNTLEPFETKFPIPSAGETIKRFLGKVRTFSLNIKPLEADVTYYVATTGSDITGNGSETAPYRTIPYALSTIPKDLGGYTATIHVADGTYNEPVNIIGYCGGYIILKRNGSQELNSACNINSIRVEYCDSVSVSGFNLVNSEGTSVFANMCKFVNMAYCQSIVETETDEVSFNFDYVAVGRIIGCRSLNHNMCLRSYSSNVTSHSWSDDSQGKYGIFSDGGGRVVKGNVFQPKGLIANEVHPGGGINVNQFGASIGTLGYELTVHVATTGSDTTGNGTQANPFRTIQRAVDIIPKDLNGYRAVIEVAAGTYDEHVYISSFNGGRIAINSDSKNTLVGSCSVKSISAKFCSAYVYLNGFNLTYAEDAALVVWGCQHVMAVCCQSTVSARTKAGIYIMESRARINYCRIANRNVALRTVDSAVTSEEWDQAGSINNDYGLFASYGATIHKTGAQPTGLAANEARDTSGTFFNENGTQISKITNSGLSCTWGTLSGGYIRHGNMSGTAMVTIQCGILVSTNLSAGTDYLITGFPPPIPGANVIVNFGAWGYVENCWMDLAGNIHLYLKTNMKAGTGSLLGATYITMS